MPFFKEVHIVNYINENTHFKTDLEIVSSNDSTTKAIIFDYQMKLPDSNCGILQVFFSPDNLVGECAYCKDLAKDSLMLSLKNSNFPCYMELKKGDSVKRVQLVDWNNKNHK